MEHVKSEIQHKELIVDGFFIPKYAKFTTLELYSTFIEKYCDGTKFEELEIDTGSLYQAMSEHD